MKEVLSIMQMIAEEKDIKKRILRLISDDFKLISYYQKNRPYCGARTAEEQEKDQKAKLQTVHDLLRRFSAIRKAHTKANRETMVVVPAEPNLFDLIQGKTPGKEEITIAEAINRKNFYRFPKKHKREDTTEIDRVDLESIAFTLSEIYNRNFNSKSSFDEAAKREVQYQLDRRFPTDSKNSWSQDRYTETKKQLEAETEVIRIDPYKLIENNAIQKFYDQVQRYILDIDTILSQANASTIVEIEY